MKIAVVGTGYVGLVTGTCLSEAGNTVTCIDIDEEKIRKLRRGIMPIYEPGLKLLFDRNVTQGRLTFSKSLPEGIDGAKAIFLALPTPQSPDGSANLDYIFRVADQLGPLLKRYTVIIDKSTVPVGTAEIVKERIASGAMVAFDVVSNPEFLREGVAVDDFLKPDRVVIGTRSARARKVMEAIYAPFLRQGNPLLVMDERSAELTKYAANAFLSTKISFMNEIANLSEKAGCNIEMIRRGIGTDSRIGNRFLYPGLGFGGSCFPKDVKALMHTSKQHAYEFKILSAVIDVNAAQRLKFIDPMRKLLGGTFAGKTIAIWGLAFKPHTDDIREAPAIYNIEQMIREGALVKVYDPEAMENVKQVFGNKIEYHPTPYEAAKGSDAIFIATEWPEFRTPDFELLKSIVHDPVIFDGRNLYDPAVIESYGFAYYSVGRTNVEAKAEKGKRKRVARQVSLHGQRNSAKGLRRAVND